MEIEQDYNAQIKELQKLSYGFYTALARGNEPLTYTIKNETSGNEHQIEVNAEIKNIDSSIDVFIGFDTDFAARFNKSKGSVYHFQINNLGEWALR